MALSAENDMSFMLLKYCVSLLKCITKSTLMTSTNFNSQVQKGTYSS